MAEKYISVEAASAYAPLPKHLREYQTSNLDDAWEDGYDFAIGQIQALPAADVVERKRGEWRQIGPKEAVCTVCNAVALVNGIDRTGNAHIHKALYKFCPKCGAWMVGEGE